MEEKYAEQDQGGTVGVAVGDTLGAGLLMTADEIEGQYGQVETIRGGGWLNRLFSIYIIRSDERVE